MTDEEKDEPNYLTSDTARLALLAAAAFIEGEGLRRQMCAAVFAAFGHGDAFAAFRHGVATHDGAAWMKNISMLAAIGSAIQQKDIEECPLINETIN